MRAKKSLTLVVIPDGSESGNSAVRDDHVLPGWSGLLDLTKVGEWNGVPTYASTTLADRWLVGRILRGVIQANVGLITTASLDE